MITRARQSHQLSRIFLVVFCAYIVGGTTEEVLDDANAVTVLDKEQNLGSGVRSGWADAMSEGMGSAHQSGYSSPESWFEEERSRRLGEGVTTDYKAENRKIPFQDLMDLGEVIKSKIEGAGKKYKKFIISSGNRATSHCVDSLMVMDRILADEQADTDATKASRRLLTKTAHCKSTCTKKSTEGHPWFEKCKWDDCNGCDECLGPTPPPTPPPTAAPTTACPDPSPSPPPPAAVPEAEKLQKWTFVRRWMCKRLKRKYDRRKKTLYDCCDEANDFANPTCDVSFCWDTGNERPFKGDILPISVCYPKEDIHGEEDKCYQHFMMASSISTRIRTASMCLKTGDEKKPLVCFKQNKCDQLKVELSKVCQTDFETGTTLKDAADRCADVKHDVWINADKIGAGHPNDDCQTEPKTPWGKALRKKNSQIIGMFCDA
jgi:hypothetical protein